MTPEEAIQELKIIKSNIASYECNTPQCKVKWWPEVTYNALNMAVDALEKQTSRKIKYDVFGYASCPQCRESLEEMDITPRYCPYCGQALDWSEVEE